MQTINQRVLSTQRPNGSLDHTSNAMNTDSNKIKVTPDGTNSSETPSADYDEKTRENIIKGRKMVEDYFKRDKKTKASIELGWQNPLANYVDPILTIYQEDCLDSLESYVLGCSDDRELARIKSLVSSILERGTTRKLRLISDDWKTQLDQLENEHPNFSEVIDYLRGGFALASATDKVLNIDPMLFAGEPGVGKSMFASRFAQIVQSSVTYLRMETAQSNSTLVGAECFWSNAKHGKVLENLVFGEYANPVIYLDELDKVSADRFDPLAALYALLEPETAKKFSDLCYPFLMLDASRIMWVATCNEPGDVPLALRSRFKIFHIEALGESQSLTVAQNIITKTCEKYFLVRPALNFSEDAVMKLKLYSPRKMQQLVREAIGRAIFRGRHTILPCDILQEKLVDRTIGFY